MGIGTQPTGALHHGSTMDAQDSNNESAWRDELAPQVAGAFSLVYLLAIPIVVLMTQGRGSRFFLAFVSLTCAACTGLPWLIGFPTGRLRTWLLVGPAVLSALAGFATVGFLSGPAVVLTLTLVTGGILLGRSSLVSLSLLALLGLIAIAWGTASGVLPAPNPENVALTNPSTWLRTIAVTFLAIFVLGTLVVGVIAKLEHSLQRVRAETTLREKAERARANAEIAALEAKQLETLGRLAAGVAHDFNNSLTAIIGGAELLRDLTKGQRGEALAEVIMKSSERAAALTRQLLAYSRKAQMVLEPVDLHELIHGALTLLRISLPTNIAVALELSAMHSIVPADAALLQNAIVNLLINARDAMPSGGRMTISSVEHDVQSPSDAFGHALSPGKYILLEILDTGTGIDPATLPRIFEPFFTTKSVGQGTGLGLAAVAGTIRAHGGAIDVQSEVGNGSAFRVLVPQADVAEVRTARAASSQIARGKGHILLVDDDVTVRTTAEQTIRMFGYDVTATEDGTHAIDLVRSSPDAYDLMLLDLRMPGLSGTETFERIHAMAPRLPIVIWSGYGAEHEVESLLEQGAVAFVQKPYAVAALSQTLARIVSQRPNPPRIQQTSQQSS